MPHEKSKKKKQGGKKARPPTPYAMYVKANYAKYRHLDTPQARIKAIAAAWRATKAKATSAKSD